MKPIKDFVIQIRHPWPSSAILSIFILSKPEMLSQICDATKELFVTNFQNWTLISPLLSTNETMSGPSRHFRKLKRH